MMKSQISKSLPFYQSLGKLFYAVAIADNSIDNQEFATLQTYVRDVWLDMDDLEDAFGEDAAYLIEMVFEGVEAFSSNGEDMYNAFIEFKKEHPEFFTPSVNKIIVQTARAIATSYQGVGTSERNILIKLEEALLIQS